MIKIVRNNKKGLADIVLILIIIVLLGVVIFFVDQNRQATDKAGDEPSPSALNIDDDWKTFEHDRLGYTFKYPPDFEQRGEEPFPGYLIEKLNTPPGSTVSIIPDNTWNTECRNVGVDCSCVTNPDSLKVYMEGFKKYPDPNIKYTGTVTLETATNTVEGVTNEVNTRGYGVDDDKYNMNSINFPMCLNGQYYAIGFMAYKGYDLYDLSTKVMSTFRLIE